MKNSSFIRSFPLGTEWLYFKIYTSEKNAEEILFLSLKNLKDELFSEGLITKWFFIRYYDDDFHIRIRFQVSNNDFKGRVWEKCSQVLSNLMYKGVAWNVLMDTYNREVERYSLELLEFSEDVFFKDSEMIMNSLSIINTSSNIKIRVLLGMLVMDHYFNLLLIDYDERLRIIDLYKDYYKKELAVNNIFFKQLNKKYNTYKSEIENLFSNNNSNNDMELDLLRKQLFSLTSDEIDLLSTSDNFHQILGSYIHMSINRLFITKNRENEYVLYEFLSIYYKSLVKRKLSTKMVLS